jgi:hypothetical protein
MAKTPTAKILPDLTKAAEVTNAGAPASPGGASPAPKKARKQLADHVFLKTDGTDSGSDPTPETAAYEYRDRNTKEVFRVDFGALSPAQLLMAAAFGLKTKAGHVSSGERNSDGGSELSDVQAIRAWFDYYIANNKWTLPREGGPRYDADTLAAAIAEVKGGNAADYLAKINSDLQIGGKPYGTAAFANTEFRAAYDRLKGKTVPTAADF